MRGIRRRPPAEALEWARGSFGPGSRIGAPWPLCGGQSHANHALDIVDAPGTVHEVVLRRWVRDDWARTDPQFSPAQEAANLRLLSRSRVPAPRLLATDPAAQHCEVPAILMGRLPGSRIDRPIHVASFVAQLATVLAVIQRVDPEQARASVPPYRPYYGRPVLRVPTWTHQPAVWAEAIEVATADPPQGPTCFIHRDFHPGNTLWLDGRLTGVVDWTSASWGPPAVDLAHLRANLAMDFGQAIADAMEGASRAGGEVAEDLAYWDLRVAVDFLPDLPPARTASPRLRRLERFVVAALSRLG